MLKVTSCKNGHLTSVREKALKNILKIPASNERLTCAHTHRDKYGAVMMKDKIQIYNDNWRVNRVFLDFKIIIWPLFLSQANLN